MALMNRIICAHVFHVLYEIVFLLIFFNVAAVVFEQVESEGRVQAAVGVGGAGVLRAAAPRGAVPRDRRPRPRFAPLRSAQPLQSAHRHQPR